MALEGSHEEHIIVNGTLLSGIQNISFSQNVQEQAVSYLGNDFGGTTINGPTVVSAAIDKVLLNEDFITGLTGSTNITGQFEYGDNLADFSQAVLNSYAVSTSIGELPQISFDLSIYGSISGAEITARPAASNDNSFETINQEKLIITYDKGPTNPIQSFNFSETFNVQPIYGIGQTTPSHISIVGPIICEASISIEVENYEFEETFSFLSGSKNRSRDIKLQISGEAGILNTFEVDNASLISENITAGVGDTVIANFSYRGYKKV